MEHVRRGWNRDKEGWWYCPVSSRGNWKEDWKVKLTGGGEEKLFGTPDDESEPLLAELFQNATHIKQLNKVSFHPDITEIFDADNPVPYLESLELLGRYSIGPVVKAIKSEKLSDLKFFAWKYAYVYVQRDLPARKRIPVPDMCVQSTHIDLAHVMESGRMRQLQTLNLSHTRMTAKNCEAYANAIRSEKLPSLKCINFSNNHIGIGGFEALGCAIESGALKNLTGFDLSCNHYRRPNTDNETTRAHTRLAKSLGSGSMRALEILSLSETGMGSDGWKAYVQAISSGELPCLSCIDVASNHFVNADVEAIRGALRSGKLKNLTRLDLRYNDINDQGISVLAETFQKGETSMLPKLIDLRLSYNQVTEEGLVFLAAALESGRLNSLEFLELRQGSGKISREAISALVSAFSTNVDLTVDVYIEWDEFPALRRRVKQLIKRNKRKKAISEGLMESLKVRADVGKIYLCGSPEVGKTTLCRTLQQRYWQSWLMWLRRPHVERTRGIDVSKFSSQSNKQGENVITLQVWDMAGQEDYHVIHNAFFPELGSAEGKATSFVVVCNSKNVEKESKVRTGRSKTLYEDDPEQEVDDWLEELKYWLKFIASSCGESTYHRHVFVVLNNFNSKLKRSTYSQLWEQGLAILKEDFKHRLDIQTDAFIMDVRKYSSVQPLKKRLLEHSRSLLKDEMIPGICQFIQKNLTHLSQSREQFPVLHWPDFVDLVHQCSGEQWPEETLETATKYLNEAGVVIYIDKEPPSHWDMQYRKLVVLNPRWFCGEIVGHMFLHQNMGYPPDKIFRSKVNGKTGSISESDFGKFSKQLLGTTKEWSSEDFGDLIAILLWLGLCYKGRGQELFIPSLIAENITPWDHWKSGPSGHGGEDQWVMGFSVQHSKSEVTLAPVALWHRFQVELAQIPRFNGRADNDFVTGKYFITFCSDDMLVLIEARVDKRRPTFNDISIFVKPSQKVVDLDGNRRKQSQVDLASDLAEKLLGLWIKVCPGVDYLYRVVWPWPVSQSRPQIMSERNVEVEEVKKWVQEHGLGKPMRWRVGSTPVNEDQLLPTKDKKDLLVHDSLDMLREFSREAVEEGICPFDLLTGEVPCEGTSVPLDETEMALLPSSASGRLILRKLESLDSNVKKIVKQLGTVEDLVREVLKKERVLIDKLQDTGEFILQDRERICPRFIYLKEKGSGTWMTLRDALSPMKTTHLQFLCEARYKDYRQHEVKDQEGLDLSGLKDWAKTIGPWLKVSLAVMFISAKVAANVVAPGVGWILPNFVEWQQLSSLSEGIAVATGFSKEELDKHIREGMGLDVNDRHQNARKLNGKSRKALSLFLEKLTPKDYEKKLGLRRVRLSCNNGSHEVLWICRECYDKYKSDELVTEFPI